jgi:tetratricopeptide (TPR) repeat protein
LETATLGLRDAPQVAHRSPVVKRTEGFPRRAGARAYLISPRVVSASQLCPDDYVAHNAKGDVLLAQGRYQEAIDVYRRALILNPNSVAPGLPLAYNLLGEPEQTIAYVDQVMRRSPHDPWSKSWYDGKGQAYGILQNYQEALVWYRRGEAVTPDSAFNGFVRSGLLALAGLEADARATMQRYLANPKAPLRTITQLHSVQLPADNPRFLAYRQKFEEGLQKAGLPE